MDQALFAPRTLVQQQDLLCARCSVREICLPAGLSLDELEGIEGRMVTVRRRLKSCELLFQCGDRFYSLYAIRTGHFKTRVTSKSGREQVTGFQMAGELCGLDGIGTGRHELDAVALSDSQVCVIPYAELKTLCLEMPSLQQQLHRLMSREIARTYGVMLQLGSMNAEERLAAFLLDQTHRQRARGLSSSSILLHSSREEIGSYLGLTIETVSRTFSKFQAIGLLGVHHRHIEVLDLVWLQQIVDGDADACAVGRGHRHLRVGARA
jgi:CRP/FNR family transcriptional regulator